jgi:hypothetical protein
MEEEEEEDDDEDEEEEDDEEDEGDAEDQLSMETDSAYTTGKTADITDAATLYFLLLLLLPSSCFSQSQTNGVDMEQRVVAALRVSLKRLVTRDTKNKYGTP